MLDVEIVDLPPVEPAAIPVELREIPPLDLTGAIEQTLDMTICTAISFRCSTAESGLMGQVRVVAN